MDTEIATWINHDRKEKLCIIQILASSKQADTVKEYVLIIMRVMGRDIV